MLTRYYSVELARRGSLAVQADQQDRQWNSDISED